MLNTGLVLIDFEEMALVTNPVQKDEPAPIAAY